jgi:hypothetical protein
MSMINLIRFLQSLLFAIVTWHYLSSMLRRISCERGNKKISVQRGLSLGRLDELTPRWNESNAINDGKHHVVTITVLCGATLDSSLI